MLDIFLCISVMLDFTLQEMEKFVCTEHTYQCITVFKYTCLDIEICLYIALLLYTCS